jgi:predicted MFS family arabinose efflux permease
MVSIVVPLIVLDRLGGSVAAVGIVFGLSGVAAMASVLLFGRIDSRGRELRLLVLPMLAMAPATALLLVADSSLGTAVPLVAYAALGASLMLIGLLEGPLDIGLFTIRQRRTDPAWMGRAFAISMAVNFLGFPIGAAVAGVLAATSLDVAIVVGVGACLAAATIASVMIPRRDPPPSGSGPAWVGVDEGLRTTGQPEAGPTVG